MKMDKSQLIFAYREVTGKNKHQKVLKTKKWSRNLMKETAVTWKMTVTTMRMNMMMKKLKV